MKITLGELDTVLFWYKNFWYKKWSQASAAEVEKAEARFKDCYDSFAAKLK